MLTYDKTIYILLQFTLEYINHIILLFVYYLLIITFASFAQSNYAVFRWHKLFLNYYRTYCESGQYVFTFDRSPVRTACSAY